MEKELKKSLDQSTVILSIIALVASLFIIFSSIYFEKKNFHKRFARLVSIDFAQIAIQTGDQDQQVSNAIDKYELISGQRFSIHSTEIYSLSEVGDFVFTSVGNRHIRFEIKPVDSYFTNRITTMAGISFFISAILLFLVRLVFMKLVFRDIIESNNHLNKILEMSYSGQLTQQELIAHTQKFNTPKISTFLKTTHKLMRRLAHLPKSRAR